MFGGDADSIQPNKNLDGGHTLQELCGDEHLNESAKMLSDLDFVLYPCLPLAEGLQLNDLMGF